MKRLILLAAPLVLLGCGPSYDEDTTTTTTTTPPPPVDQSMTSTNNNAFGSDTNRQPVAPPQP